LAAASAASFTYLIECQKGQDQEGAVVVKLTLRVVWIRAALA
jgi:hypothetical protein